MVKIGLLRVLSTEDEELLSSHGRLIEEFIPDPRLQTVNRCIEEHPRGVWNEEEEARAVPKILRLGQAMAREDGVDALIVSCASDPGVKGLRAELGIPVLGAGSAAASAALAVGRPVGVLSITDTVPQPVEELLGERIVAL
ncbi:MAG: aspartate/glutamate racemase family protein, partial [Anaerolineae bacterium]